jgi:hypothetical protein
MGPTVAIWLRDVAREPIDLLGIARAVDPECSSAVDFHIQDMTILGGKTKALSDPRPFGMNIGTTGFFENELASVIAAVGFVPTVAIHAFAYANRETDHRILGELGLYLARRFDGLVDFGGSLGSVTAAVGTLYTIPYVDSDEPVATFHVGDAEFLESWLKQPSFHMVK